MEAAPAQRTEEKDMEVAKAKGNGHFKDGQFPDAIAAYGKVVELWEALGEDHTTKSASCNKCAVAALNNRAACYIQVRDFDDAIVDTTRLLEVDSKNAKAYLRRGTCYEHIEKHKKCLGDMEMVLKLDPGSTQAKDINNRVKKVMKALGVEW